MQEYAHPFHRKGIALLEVMIAVGLLTFAVAAISSAIVAGQQHSLEARKTIRNFHKNHGRPLILGTDTQKKWAPLLIQRAFRLVGIGIPLAGEFRLLKPMSSLSLFKCTLLGEQ
jgi:hypothetical protein